MRLFETKDPTFRSRWEGMLQNRRRGLEEVEEVVRDILRRVREEGDRALVELTQRFDGVELQPEDLEVPRGRWSEALQALDGGLLEALKGAAREIEAFCRRELPRDWMDMGHGVVRGEVFKPVERAGVYVPGGKAFYPSSVLMGVIPAKVAGVREVTVVTPPGDRRVSSVVLAAAEVAGADRLFQVGGAQAIAALAYGTERVPKVDVIVGPGNRYVTAAKKALYGEVGIDMLAGPSELLILSDGSTSPRAAALDLLSQAEHDEDAWVGLLTPDGDYAQRVREELEGLLRTAPRGEIASMSIEAHGFVVLTRDLEEGIALVDEFAPEHLELHLRDPWGWFGRVGNAGGVFLGEETPVTLGDYGTGPNHILPTGGAARFSSAVGVWTFLKRIQFLHTSGEALARASRVAIPLAEVEGLFGHANAVRRRLEDGEEGRG